MAAKNPKLRIFAIGVTSVIISLSTFVLIRSGLIIDYNTIQVIVFLSAMNALVFLVSIYAMAVLVIEDILIKWGNRVFTAEEKNDYIN